MFANQKKLAKALAITTFLASPATLMAGGLGDSGVRDSTVSNAARAQALVPCPRLDRNVPASLAAEMDCGRATPRVAGERVRNTGGGLFGGHNIGSAPPANSDDDSPVSNVRDRSPSDDDDGPTNSDDGPTDGDDGPTDGGDGPTDGGDGPTDGGDGPTDGGDGPTDGGDGPTNESGPKSKTERLNELGVPTGQIGNQSEAFQDSFNDYLEDNGFRGDWSDFNPPE